MGTRENYCMHIHNLMMISRYRAARSGAEPDTQKMSAAKNE